MMEGNDLINYDVRGYGIMFEGVLATPPDPKLLDVIRKRRDGWDKIIPRWHANELPLKSMIDTTNRLGIGCEVYTFLSPDAVDPIDRWLIRKGISVPVSYYEDAKFLEYDLRFNRSIRTVLVGNQDDAMILGMRARVTASDRGWMI
jgi:hypothetical protein